jgi:hypothetical protein
MTRYGYARTSTVEQVAGLEDQIAKLKQAGCSDQSIYQEQISSVKMEDWHSPSVTDTSDRYDDTIGGITWHVNDGYFQKSLSAKQSS